MLVVGVPPFHLYSPGQDPHSTVNKCKCEK